LLLSRTSYLDLDGLNMVKLLTSNVVRGTHQGDSHGGVYLVDVERCTVDQVIDWNTGDIDWQGRGWDRGLRGIAFDGDRVYIAASDELFAYTPDFKLIGAWRNPYLKHCHEITVYQRKLFLTSTGFDSILAFDLDKQLFDWGMTVQSSGYQYKVQRFNPLASDGPVMFNKHHINMVFCNQHGMYISGLKTGGMLQYNGHRINMAVELPPGTHNAMPFREGVLFNDTNDNVLRYSGRGEGEEDRAMPVPVYPEEQLTHQDKGDDVMARAGFARGLCVLSDTVVAGGSSPATVTLYELAKNTKIASVNLTKDVRNGIHGLAVWPY